jgi:hypothetical protein
MSALDSNWCSTGFGSPGDELEEKGHEIYRRASIFGSSALRKFYGQATKGARWMPWQKQAMKDVASCDKPRGAASRH